MRALREARGFTQRDMATANGTVSEVENGIVLPSKPVLEEYGSLCYGDTKKSEQLARLYWDAFLVDGRIKDRVVNIQQTGERRKALLEDFRRIVRHIAAEIGGYSKYSLNILEELDERTRKRLMEDHAHYESFLKNLGMSRDWRLTLAPQPSFEAEHLSPERVEQFLESEFEPSPDGESLPPEVT